MMLRSSPLYLLLMASAICRAAADDGEPLGLIQLESNLADVEKPPEISPGVYTGEVQDVQLPTSAAGNQYFSVKFVIPTDELPADLRESYPDGAILYWNRNIVPKKGDRRAAYNLKVLMESLGLDTNVTEIDPNEWMGREARLRIKMGKYNGEDRAEIASVEAAEGSARASARSTPAKTTAATTRKAAGSRRGR